MADPLVVAAFGGFAATVVTVLGGVTVAIINSKRERNNAAEASADEVMEQRLLLRDEQNEHLRNQNVQLQTYLDDCVSENRRLRAD